MFVISDYRLRWRTRLGLAARDAGLLIPPSTLQFEASCTLAAAELLSAKPKVLIYEMFRKKSQEKNQPLESDCPLRKKRGFQPVSIRRLNFLFIRTKSLYSGGKWCQ
jgi:hypothetical protein